VYRNELFVQEEEHIRNNFLVNPEWVVPPTSVTGTSQWELTYLDSWEKVITSQLWPSMRSDRRLAAGMMEWDSIFRLDTRMRLRSEGFPYMGVPTRWEPYLNGLLLEKWATTPLSDHIPDTTLNWFNSRLDLIIPRVLPWINYLCWEILYPLWGWSFYIGGLALGLNYFYGPTPWRNNSLSGIQVTPLERSNPRGGYPGVAKRLKTTTGEGYLLRQEDRFFRRWGGTTPPTRNPERSFRVEHHWSWEPEFYWASRRQGFSRQAPRLGRRRERSFKNEKVFTPLKERTRSSFSHGCPGGGLGYHFIRSSLAKSQTTLQVNSSQKSIIWVPHWEKEEGTWLFRGVTSFLPEKENLDLPEVTYPARGRRRILRGDDRLLTPEGTRALHRRGQPPRGWEAQNSPRHMGRSAKELLSRPPLLWKITFPSSNLARAALGGYLLKRYRTSLTFKLFSHNPKGVVQAGLLELGRVKFGHQNSLTEVVSTPGGMRLIFTVMNITTIWNMAINLTMVIVNMIWMREE